MSPAFVRIDSRLIHGQIIEAWLPYLNTNNIIVIDDSAAGNLLQKSVMEMSVSKPLSLKIYSINEAIKNLAELNCLNDSLILFSSLEDIYKMYNSGFKFNSLNIGNLHFCKGKKQVSNTVCLNNEEIDIIKSLKEAGLKISIQVVPSEKIIDIEKIWDILNT